MKARSREEYDADTHESYGGPTRLRTDDNKKLVTCGACGDAYYVSEVLFESMKSRVGYDPGNAFVCPRCDEEGLDTER